MGNIYDEVDDDDDDIATTHSETEMFSLSHTLRCLCTCIGAAAMTTAGCVHVMSEDRLG